MCDDRERLIGYLYDECDASERRLIDQHLQECADCRAEVHALRSVRSDLLAWDVRGEPDVWRPVAATPVSWWQQVPAWAMAAAAGLVLAAGVTGGIAARALSASPAPEPMVRQTAPEPVPVRVSAGAGAEELAAIEQRLLTLVRAEMARRGPVASPQLTAVSSVDPGQVRDLADQSDQMLFLINTLYSDLLRTTDQTDAKIRSLQLTVDSLAAGTPGR
jgi:hypothetical protein